MTSILQNPKGISNANPSTSILPPINQPMQQSIHTAPGGKRSLNREARKKELMKITAEN